MVATIIQTCREATQGTTANTTQYWPIAGRLTARSIEAESQIILREAGTLNKLFARITANSINATSTFRTRNNAGNGGQSASIGNNTTGAFEDTTNSDTVAAADKFCFQTVPGAASGTMTFTTMSVNYTATTDTVTRLATASNTTYATASTSNYLQICGEMGSNTNENSGKSRLRKAGSMKNLMINVISNARTTATTAALRLNGATSALSISIGSTVTGFLEDTADSVAVANGDDINYIHTTGTGTQNQVIGSIAVSYVTTSVQGNWGFVSGGRSAGMTINANLTNYFAIGGFHGEGNTNETQVQKTLRGVFSFVQLIIFVSANSVTAASTLRTRLNGANGVLSASITASTTGIFLDSTNTEDCVDGDAINYQLVTGATGTSMSIRQIAMHSLSVTAQNIVKTLPTETTSISESSITRLAAKTRTRTDTAITVGETRARLSAKMRPLSTQTTTLSESVIRVKGKVKTLATETITVTGGTLARLLAKIRTGSDTTAIVENRARLAAKNRALATQTTTVGAGTIAEIKGAVKTISQTVTIGENLARLSSKIRALATQTATVGAGTAARLAAKIRAIPQTTAISENLVRIKGRLKSLATETITVTGGSIARLSAKIRTRSETATIGETSVRRKASMRVLALQTITVGENIVRLLSKIRTISQTIILSESTSRLTAKIRALSTQTVSLTEDLQRTLTAGAQNIVKTITQTIIVGESIARLKGSWRTIPQSFTVGSGTLSRLCVRVRTIIPQTIIIAENAARVSAKNRLLALQTVSLTDNRARIKGAIKTISQTIIIGENIVRRLTKIRALSIQTAVLADSVARQIIGGPVEIIRSLTQTVALSDSLGRRLTVQRILTQTVPKAESLVRVRGAVRTLSQSILLSESRSRIKSASKLISQTTLSSDSINRLNTIRRTVIQTTVLAENLAQETVGNLARSLVETITVSDNIIRRTAKLVVLAQITLITEQVNRLSAKLQVIPTETIGLSDSAINEINVIIKHLIKIIGQATTITDYVKLEVVKRSQRFRKITTPSIKRLISNHPAWLLGTRGQHDDYEEFSSG